jgi:hypothetical protein
MITAIYARKSTDQNMRPAAPGDKAKAGAHVVQTGTAPGPLLIRRL